MSIASWLLLIGLTVGIPVLSKRSADLAESAGMSRVALYANASVTLWILAVMTYIVVRLDGQRLGNIFVTAGGHTIGVVLSWTILLIAAGLLIFALSHAVGYLLGWDGETPSLVRLRPTNAHESRWLALALAPSAGICEELVYRGFVLTRLMAIAPPWVALLIASAIFGAAHAYQGILGAARAALIGLILSMPPILAGTILPSMAAHAVIDILAVLWVWPLLDRMRASEA